MTDNVAAQLWTVRSRCQDAAALASTLAALRSIGYRAVELAGLGGIPTDDVRSIVEGAGMTSCSAHADSEQILEDPGAVVRTMKALGCDSLAYPYPRNQDLSSPEGVSRLCRRLSRAGEVFHSEGITFSYHHHAIELQKVGGRTVLETILEQTDPRLLQLQPDTYWLQAGGVDPARWITRFAGRVPLLHVKDYGVDSAGKAIFREIGAGNLDWTGILSAARKAGCKWHIVEQDDHWSGGDPVESLRMSWYHLARSS
ncbi:MAG TPA: TIM barrel protein [Spirochaetia bacterium]|nr:TIM barrel protein [Spirochaetia bacterium]